MEERLGPLPLHGRDGLHQTIATMQTLVSIVIPSHNRAGLIRRTLDSILNQSYQDWECLVVDDRSEDDTKDIVQNYTTRDKRFKYLVNKRKPGAQGARNEGILQAKGDWVLLLDSDDYLFPSYLEKMLSKITDDDSIIVCYGQMVDEQSGQFLERMDRIQDGNIHSALLNGLAYVTFQASLVSRKSLIDIGLLDENCPSHQELETHLRLSRFNDYCVVPEVLWLYYVGRADTISRDMSKHIMGQIYVARKHIREYRRNAYRPFIVRMKKLWQMSGSIPGKKTAFHRQILLLAPEVPFLIIRNKLGWKRN